MGIAQRDYILRMIEQFGIFLSRIMGLKAAGKSDEALAAIEEALNAIFGSMKTLLNDVDSATAKNLVGNPDKLRLFARLMKEKGDVYEMKKDHAVSRAAYRRSLELYLESLSLGGDLPGEARDTIVELRGLVSEERLQPRYRDALRGLLGS